MLNIISRMSVVSCNGPGGPLTTSPNPEGQIILQQVLALAHKTMPLPVASIRPVLVDIEGARLAHRVQNVTWLEDVILNAGYLHGLMTVAGVPVKTKQRKVSKNAEWR